MVEKPAETTIQTSCTHREASSCRYKFCEAETTRRGFLQKIAGTMATCAVPLGTVFANKEGESKSDIDPQAIFAYFAQIKKEGGVTSPEQARAVLPMVRQLTLAMEHGTYVPSTNDLARVTTYAIENIYYKNGKLPSPEQGGTARDLPLAILRLEQELILQCEGKRSPSVSNAKLLQTLSDRLVQDVYWHTRYYNSAPEVLNYATKVLETALLPGDSEVSVDEYCAFLQRLQHAHLLSFRVTLCSHDRAHKALDECLLHKETMNEDDVVALEGTVAILRRRCDAYAAIYPSDTEVDSAKVTALKTWMQESLYRTQSRILAERFMYSATLEDRNRFAEVIARNIEIEDQEEALFSRIRKWGLTPTDAIIGFPQPDALEAKAYGVDEASTLFIDCYRTAMGLPASTWLHVPDTMHSSQKLQLTNTWQNNAIQLFPAVLSALAQSQKYSSPDEYGADINTLWFMALHGMRHELQYSARFPDMNVWGERTGRMLAFAGESHLFKKDEQWETWKANKIAPIIAPDGFMSNDGTKSTPVPGLLVQFAERLPEKLCRDYETNDREKMRKSWLFDEAVAKGRGDFIRAFLAVTARKHAPHDRLLQWGFSEKEIENIQNEDL